MQKLMLVSALLLLLAVWLTGPAFTLSDPGDSYPDTGDTITLFLAVVGSCIGALFSLVLLIYPPLHSAAAGVVILLPRPASAFSLFPTPDPFWFGRPLFLRI